MFANASDKQNSINRTGSHATKPFAAGRVDVLPPEARPWEEIFLSFKDQLALVEAKLDAAYAGMRKCDERLLETLPYLEFTANVKHRAQWSEKVAHYTKISQDLRDVAMKSAANSLAGCFLEAAKLVLTDEEFNAVMESAKEILGTAASVDPVVGYTPPAKLVPLTAAQVNERNKQYRRVLRPSSPGAIRDKEHDKKYGR